MCDKLLLFEMIFFNDKYLYLYNMYIVQVVPIPIRKLLKDNFVIILL